MSAPITWVVTGPTCGGKSGWAEEMARRFGWPILSLDSMKVYRRLDIGTAKPSSELRRELRFELIDLREPWETFSASNYLEEWRRVSATIEGPRIISGGTAFYLNALREGLFEGPGPNEEIRVRLIEEAERGGTAPLHRRLAEVDPVSAARIHTSDLRRIVRALEVQETSGEPISAWQARRTPLLDPETTAYLGVFRPRSELYERIDARVERMFAAGWVDEVRQLMDAHDPAWSVQAAQSIGYERIRQALVEGRDPREEIPTIRSRTHAFARCQITWVRKMPLEWWRVEEREDFWKSIDSDASREPDESRRARRNSI